MVRIGLLLLSLIPGMVFGAFDSRIKVVIEEPIEGGQYSGISNLRGWAISPEGMYNDAGGFYFLQIYVDRELRYNLAPFGQREDVGEAFPDYPDSDTGGFAMAFNYKDLNPGEHEITVVATDSQGNYNSATATFNTERFESSFIPSVDEVDLSTTESISLYDNQSYLVSGPSLEGKQWDFLLKWDTASQSFKTEGILPHARSNSSGSTSSSSGGYTSSGSGSDSSGSTDTSNTSDPCDGPGYNPSCNSSGSSGSSGSSSSTASGSDTSSSSGSSSSSSSSSSAGSGSDTSSGSGSDGSGSDSSSDGSAASSDITNVELPAAFAPNSRASYRVQYTSDDPYSVGLPASDCSVDICENFDMTVSFSSTGRKENGRDIISARYQFYDGPRSLDFYYDQNGNLRQLTSWDGKYDQYDYTELVWGTPLNTAQKSVASEEYVAGIGFRATNIKRKDLVGRLDNLGNQYLIMVPAFPQPVQANIIELRAEMTWLEGNVDYPAGSKADVYQVIHWSDEHGILKLKRTVEVSKAFVTGDFSRPTEIEEVWEMTVAP